MSGQSRRIALLVLVGAAVLYALVTIVAGLRTELALDGYAARAPGTVLDVSRGRWGIGTETLSFAGPRGSVTTTVPRPLSDRHESGDAVTVEYRPADPAQARVAGTHVWTTLGLESALTAVLGVVAALVVVRRLR